MENKFNEKDKEQLVEFLNLVAKHAKFEVDTGQLITYFRALSHMQQVVLPKLESHILEIKKVVEISEEAKKETKKLKTARKKS